MWAASIEDLETDAAISSLANSDVFMFCNLTYQQLANIVKHIKLFDALVEDDVYIYLHSNIDAAILIAQNPIFYVEPLDIYVEIEKRIILKTLRRLQREEGARIYQIILHEQPSKFVVNYHVGETRVMAAIDLISEQLYFDRGVRLPAMLDLGNHKYQLIYDLSTRAAYRDMKRVYAETLERVALRDYNVASGMQFPVLAKQIWRSRIDFMSIGDHSTLDSVMIAGVS